MRNADEIINIPLFQRGLSRPQAATHHHHAGNVIYFCSDAT
jgi:hypothetical protein